MCVAFSHYLLQHKFFFFWKTLKNILAGKCKHTWKERNKLFVFWHLSIFVFTFFWDFFSLTTSLSLKRIEFHTQSTTFRCDGLECIVSSKNIKILSILKSTLKKFRIVKVCDYFKFSFKCLDGSTKLLYCRCWESVNLEVGC